MDRLGCHWVLVVLYYGWVQRLGKPGQAVPSDESSQHDPPGGPGLVPLEVAVVTGEITVGGREVTIVSGGVLVCDTEGVGIDGIVMLFIC